MQALWLARLGGARRRSRARPMVDSFSPTLPKVIGEPARPPVRGGAGARARGPGGGAQVSSRRPSSLADQARSRWTIAGRDPVLARPRRARRGRRGAGAPSALARVIDRGRGGRNAGAVRSQPRAPREARGEAGARERGPQALRAIPQRTGSTARSTAPRWPEPASASRRYARAPLA